jgi:acyl transferase domain-containing protein
VQSDGAASLEAHGTGTALGDPIEVGAATRARCWSLQHGSTELQATSLKSNMGHLEAAAAAAGLASLITGPLLAGAIPLNAQLRGLNAHLSSILSSRSFLLPVEVLPCRMHGDAPSTARLSSFGFSGTIAHGAFAARNETVLADIVQHSKSLYRGHHTLSTGIEMRPWLSWLIEVPGPKQYNLSLDDAASSIGTLTASVIELLSDHVVGGNIFLPGVGYVEMAFTASRGRNSALTAAAFLRPCILPGPSDSWECVLRCTQRETGSFEISSRPLETSVDSSFLTHFTATLADSTGTHKAGTYRPTTLSYRIEAPSMTLLKLSCSNCWSAASTQAVCRASSPWVRTSAVVINPLHVSRHASSLAVPQEDSMCGDGPTMPSKKRSLTLNDVNLVLEDRIMINNSMSNMTNSHSYGGPRGRTIWKSAKRMVLYDKPRHE